MNPLSGVLNEAWRMYKTFAKHLLAIAFVIYLVAAIVTALLALAGGTFGFLLGSSRVLIAAFVLQATLVKAVQDVRDGRADLSISETVSLPCHSLSAVAGPRSWPASRSRSGSADHRPRPVPDHHLGRDRPGHQSSRGPGRWRRSGAAVSWSAAAAGTCSARWCWSTSSCSWWNILLEPDLLGPAACARRRPELGHLGHPDLPVPRPRGHARVLPAGRQSQRPRGPVRRIPAGLRRVRPAAAGRRPVRRATTSRPRAAATAGTSSPRRMRGYGGYQQPPQGGGAAHAAVSHRPAGVGSAGAGPPAAAALSGSQEAVSRAAARPA